MSLDPEQIDLADLAKRLAERLPDDGPPAEYLPGKTLFRDLVVAELGCSELTAEAITDTLVLRGFLRFSGDPTAAEAGGIWLIDPKAV